MNYLLVLVPVSLVLAYLVRPEPGWIFLTAVLAIIPLAEWIRRGTEQIARHAGPTIGGLLNVSLGNMAELVLGLALVRDGHTEVVKAQITGAIIANSLLGLGLAVVIASFWRSSQSFSRERAGMLSSMLLLCMIGLLLPGLFDYTERHIPNAPPAGPLDIRLSLGVSVVLIAVYIGNLFYTLVSRRDVFELKGGAPEKPEWPVWRALAVLAAATAVVTVEAELISHAIEGTAASLGLSKFFLGVVPLAVIGNAPEYFSAVYFAKHEQMGLVMTITVGSSIQIALLVAPLLVLISYFLGRPMDLVFTSPLEMLAIGACAFTVNAIAQDGETTWFEGALLLAVYLLFCLAFFFLTF